MKYCFTLLLILTVLHNSYGQCPSYVSLADQAEVDAFIANYPNCQHIAGGLDIGHYFFNQDDTDITDISGLSNIQTIGGKLMIGNTLLVNFDGLDNLVSIDSYIFITQNDSLENVDAFSSLTTVGGNVHFNANHDLESLSGFSNISSIGGNLEITHHHDLVEIIGFSQLTNIPGGLYFDDSPLLTDLEGFHNIQSVDGGLGVSIGGTGITDLYGLRSLQSINAINNIYGNLLISLNPNLTSLYGLEQLTFIEKSLNITHSPLLIDLNNLSNLNHVEKLTVKNTGITNFSGLENIQLNNRVRIQDNPNLVDLNDLDFGPVIFERILLENNPQLIDISSLSTVDSIYGSSALGLEISNNDALEDLTGLENLVWIGDDLDISGNEVLTDISALYNLNTIEEDLRLNYNDLLSDCLPICELIQNGVGGSKSISNNLTGCNSVSEITSNSCVPQCIATINPIYAFQIVHPDCSTVDINPQDLLSLGSGCGESTFVFFDGVNEFPSISFDCSQQGIHSVEIIVDDVDFYYTEIEVNDDAMICRPDNFLLTGPTMADNFHGALDFIQSDQHVISPHIIHYEAGDEISLDSSFEVMIGSDFEASINTMVCPE